MVAQHFVFVAAGFLFVYGVNSMIWAWSRMSTRVSKVYNSMLTVNSWINRRGLAAFVVAGLLIAYWYIPSNFDAAVVSERLHVVMHLTFLLAGGLIYSGAKMLPKRTQRIAPIVVGKTMGLGGVLLLLTTMQLYTVYPVAQQVDAGVVLVFAMLILDFTLVPIWLYSYFGRPVGSERN